MFIPQLAAALVGLGLASTAAADVSIDQCGQVVPAGQTGVLTTDLTCESVPGSDYAVKLENGARLDMAGHTITVLDGRAILGQKRSRVFSSTPNPGRLVKSGRGSIAVSAARVEHLEITGFSIGVGGVRGRVRVRDVTVTGATTGVWADRPRVEDCTLDGNFTGIAAQRKARVENTSTSSNRYDGVVACRVVASGLLSVGNGVAGVRTALCRRGRGRMILMHSEVTGNPSDLVAAKLPKLVDTLCHTSAKVGAGGTWGICLND